MNKNLWFDPEFAIMTITCVPCGNQVEFKPTEHNCKIEEDFELYLTKTCNVCNTTTQYSLDKNRYQGNKHEKPTE